MFTVRVIAPNATVVVYVILFGSIHHIPIEDICYFTMCSLNVLSALSAMGEHSNITHQQLCDYTRIVRK